MMRWTFGILLLATVACSKPPRHTAKVSLSVDGQGFDYTTGQGQFDQQVEGGPLSVYFPRDEADGDNPYVCLRYYSGSPVGHLWVRYRKPGVEGDPKRYECFVPGVLSDGTQTLGWKKADGSERHKPETGEAGCKATVTRDGQQLRLDFEGTFTAEAKKKKKGKAEDEAAAPDTIRASGSARMKIAGS